MIDADLARLEEIRDALDFEAIERDRAGAPERALFDPSRDMVLARKYEAATDRAMHKALKEFREVEADALASDASPAPQISSETVASFGSGPEPADPTDQPVVILPRRSLPLTLPTAPLPVLKAREECPKRVELAETG